MRAFLRPSVVLLVVGALAVLGLTAAGASVGGAGAAVPATDKAGLWEAEAVPGELIVGFAPGVAGESRDLALEVVGIRRSRDLLVPSYALVSVPVGEEAAYAGQLSALPGVVSVEMNLTNRDLAIPNDEFYGHQWHLHQIGLDDVWEKATGTGVTVAVLDSGVAFETCAASVCGQDFYRAPDFEQTEFVSPWDFVDGDSHPNDETGHGTHVASTIAESTNNGVAGAGIAPDAAIMPVRVLGPGAGIAEESEGIIWATDNGANVINLSVGGPEVSQVQWDAVNYAQSRGVLIVAASGNGGDDLIGDPEIYCPACYPGVISVGATRIDRDIASYSNYGSSPEDIEHAIVLMAPGGEAEQDKNEDGRPDEVFQVSFRHLCTDTPEDFNVWSFCNNAGTSMASPHVAGVAALVLSVNPELTSVEVWDILTQTATDLGVDGYDGVYGFGEVNAGAAVEAAQQSLPSATPTPTATTMPPSTNTPLPLTNTPTNTPTHTPTPTSTPTHTPTSTPTPVLVGDTNCDRVVNPLDATLILQLVAGLIGALP
ncbi:MAG: S8 family serine peptidase, partial [Chloroflexi bacterium]|nr:S8 family serine peptidase [Chloroflexota bacterium]